MKKMVYLSVALLLFSQAATCPDSNARTIRMITTLDISKEDGERFLSEYCQKTWLPLVKATAKSTLVAEVDHGRVKSVQFTRKSGNAQFDLDCLQAVLGADDWYGYAFTGLFSVEFDTAKLMSQHKGFFNKLAKASNDGNHHDLTMFKIPTSVLQRFPHLFSDDEIFSSANLVETLHNDYPDNSTLGPKAQAAVVKYYQQWMDYFFQDIGFSKAKIRKQAQLISLDPVQ